MNQEKIIQELNFKFTRSGGAGGQHVNKVSTKVVLQFDVEKSTALDADEKVILQEKLQNKISKTGLLTLSADTSRSQHKNKEIVIKRFLELIKVALKPKKKRKKTKKPHSANLKRLEKKKKKAGIKERRQKPRLDY